VENVVIFIVGTIVFLLYIVGSLFMIKRQDKLHQQQLRIKNSRVRKINTSDFNGFNIDSSIIRLKARRRITKLEEMNCEYSGLPSPKAYSKETIEI
jgi:hypothetical protein